METTQANANEAVSITIDTFISASSSPNDQDQNFQLFDSLYPAAAAGDISKFEQHSHNLDQILTPNGNTILHIHITVRQPRKGNTEQETKTKSFMSWTLAMCPNLLWEKNRKGETLLHMAAKYGHGDVVTFLLDERRNSTGRRMLEMVNEAKDTALHEAVRYNHLDVVKLLIKEDPSLPYEENSACEMPLFIAAERGFEEIVKAILDTCISPAYHGPNGRTALHTAVIRNNKGNFIDLQLSFLFPISEADFEIINVLGVVSLLLNDRRIQVSNQDHKGWTPLHFAAYLRNHDFEETTRQR